MLTVGVAAGFLLALGSASVEATTIIRTGTGTNSFTGSPIKAYVRFDQASAGADIFVTLANIESSQVTLNADLLTGVFFNLNGTTALTRFSAQLADQVNNSGTQITTDSFAQNCSGASCPPGGNMTGSNVGGEFAYKFDSAGLNPSGTGAFDVDQKHGIASVGLGIFGASDRFDTSQNLSGPADPNGPQYGITSFGDTTPLSPGTVGMIHNAAVFRFTVAAGYALSSVTDVRFQYGSALFEGDIDVPLPPALMLLSSGLLGVATLVQVRRRRRSRPSA